MRKVLSFAALTVALAALLPSLAIAGRGSEEEPGRQSGGRKR